MSAVEALTPFIGSLGVAFGFVRCVQLFKDLAR